MLFNDRCFRVTKFRVGIKSSESSEGQLTGQSDEAFLFVVGGVGEVSTGVGVS
jgi:hypothetical protein